MYLEEKEESLEINIFRLAQKVETSCCLLLCAILSITVTNKESKKLMIKETLNGEVKKAINCVKQKDANIT